MTYDHVKTTKQATRSGDVWNNDAYALTIPTLYMKILTCKIVSWNDVLAPELLLEFKAKNGKMICLCDFGSAGEGGAPYRSWLSAKNLPDKVPFAKDNPLRSGRA